MSKQQTINRQACLWITKLHETTELSESERAELNAWMDENPENRAELQRMAERWDELNCLTLLAVPSDQAEQQTKRQNGTQYSSRAIKLKIGMAAAACLAIALIIWPKFQFKDTDTSSLLSYSTDIGEQQLVTLPDSSTVLLNTQSQFSVAYTENYRDIYLVHGEAHFEVSPNAEKPFRVFAGKSKVRAVGTAFSIYLKKETVEVTVTHGSIAIDSIRDTLDDTPPVLQSSSINHQSIISAGQLAEFNQLSGTIETNILPKTEQVPAWHHGQLKFSGEPLEQVVDEISRYSRLSIVILDDKLRNLRIGGLFDVGETSKMFEALENSFGVQVEHINKNLVHLTAAESNTTSI